MVVLKFECFCFDPVGVLKVLVLDSLYYKRFSIVDELVKMAVVL